MESSHSFTGTDNTVFIANDSFSFYSSVQVSQRIRLWCSRVARRCGYSTACWLWHNNCEAGGPTQSIAPPSNPLVGLQLARGGSSFLCDASVVSYKSPLKDIQEQRVNGSRQQTHTHTPFSLGVLTTAPDNEGVRTRDWQRERKRKQRERDGAKRRKREGGKQFVQVSHRVCVGAFPPAVIRWK